MTSLILLLFSALIVIGAVAYGSWSVVATKAARKVEYLNNANIAVQELLDATWTHERLDAEQPERVSDAPFTVRFLAARAGQAWVAAQNTDAGLAIRDSPGGPWLVHHEPGVARALRWTEATKYLHPRARGAFVLDGSGLALDASILGPQGAVTFVPHEELGRETGPWWNVSWALGLALMLALSAVRHRKPQQVSEVLT